MRQSLYYCIAWHINKRTRIIICLYNIIIILYRNVDMFLRGRKFTWKTVSCKLYESERARGGLILDDNA